MSAQVRRSAASVAANIAEGYGRQSTGSYIQFLKMSRGSLRELETHLLLAQRVELASGDSIQPVLTQCEKVAKMLHRLISSLQKEAADD
jgi:four helix bundle protein